MAENWKADADGILVFTGLFPAAVASVVGPLPTRTCELTSCKRSVSISVLLSNLMHAGAVRTCCDETHDVRSNSDGDGMIVSPSETEAEHMGWYSHA
ncbi:hypothetical protein EDB86DRAFT_3089614 [Lactarius hatsudake]|nr:hypothetical protein EDB86DRAFT_3089614 [Lactarius hatsudake]